MGFILNLWETKIIFYLCMDLPDYKYIVLFTLKILIDIVAPILKALYFSWIYTLNGTIE